MNNEPDSGEDAEEAAPTEAQETSPGEAEPDQSPDVHVKVNGEWVVLESSRPKSDDPEIEQLLDMGLEGLNAIVDDQAHPLHDKAVVVAAQAFAPLTDVVANWSSSAAESIAGALAGLALTPGIDKSWVTDLVVDYPNWKAFRDSLPEPTEHLVIDGIDFDSAEAPDLTAEELAAKLPGITIELLNALLSRADEQLTAQHAQMATMRDQLQTLRDQLQSQRDHTKAASQSDQAALTVSKSAKRGSWWAAWAAIAGALIAAAALIVTIFKP
ncbi:hypothetical protein [Microbacterium xylanilyticum]